MIRAKEVTEMKLSDVLDRIKEQQGASSNAEHGRLMDIDVRRIGEYYKGREPMDDDYPKIAMASGYRVDELQAIVKLSTGKDEKSREVWAKYYKSIGGIAASIALLFFSSVTLIVTSTPAEASNGKGSEAEHFVLCKLLRILRKVSASVRHTLSNAFPRYGYLN